MSKLINVELTKGEIQLILKLLKDNQENGEYYGNKDQYSEMLTNSRFALMTSIDGEKKSEKNN